MSKTRMGKRVASLLLSLVMMLSLLPTTVYATTAEPGETEAQVVISEQGDQNTEDGNVPGEGETGTDDPQPAADNAEDEQGAAAPQSGEEGTDTALLAAYNAEGEENAVAPLSGEEGADTALLAAANVAKVGETEYATLDEAIAAAESGATVTLLSDITLTETLTISKNVTLDLNGNTMTVKTNSDGIVVSNATLTLANSGAEGGYVFDCSATNSDGIYVHNTDATTVSTLNINSDVSITVSAVVNSAIHAFGEQGSTVVNFVGGKIDVTGSEAQVSAIIADQNSEINVGGGEFNLNVDFNSYNENHNDVVGVLIWGAQGKQENIAVNITDGVFSVGGRNAFAQVVQVGMVNGYSKNCAVNISGGTITLNPEGDGTGYLYATYETSYATAEISDGTVSGTVTAIVKTYISVTEIANDGVTISGGKFPENLEVADKYLADGYEYDPETGEVTEAASAAYVAQIGEKKYDTLANAIKAAESGDTVTLLANIELSSAQSISNMKLTLDLNGCTLNSTAVQTVKLGYEANLTVMDSKGGGKISNACANDSVAVYLSGTGSQFTLIRGTIESTSQLTSIYSEAISNDGKKTCTVNIKGGSVVVPEAATEGRAIVAGKNMTLNISGGTIAGGLHGVDAYSGSTVNITGGEITARYVDTGVINEAYGMRLIGTANVTVAGGTITGVKMDDDGSELNVPAVKLESGTINGSFYAITNGAITFDVAENADIVLKNDSVAQFLPDTVELVQNDDGTYGVTEAAGVNYDPNSKTITNVTPDNVQAVLDGQYGSLDGMTVILSAGVYDALELGRATAYEGSNTAYMVGGFDENADNYQKFDTAQALIDYKNDTTQWTPNCYYIRSMTDVTIQAAEGATVKVKGLTATSGDIYGTADAPVSDYVRGINNIRDTNNSFHLAQEWQNVTFEGITFTARVNINSSQEQTEISGTTFRNCTFEGCEEYKIKTPALRYYNEINNGQVSGLTVEACSFDNWFQGVYTMHINGVTVKNSTFANTTHNAIAIQDMTACNHGKVVITDNTFTDISDRVIRFNNVAAGTTITITGNTATNSGDENKEVIAATYIADGVTIDMTTKANNWGEGAVLGNGFAAAYVAAIGDVKYETLAEAVAAAKDGETVKLLADVTVDTTIAITKSVTLDLNGKYITANLTTSRLFDITEANVSFTVNANDGGMKIPEGNVSGGTGCWGFFSIHASAALTLNGGTYRGDTQNGAFVRVYSGTGDNLAQNSTVQMLNVTATSNNSILTTNKYGVPVSLTVEGGKYTIEGNGTGEGFFVFQKGGACSFSDVEITSGTMYPVQLGIGEYTITNCSFTNSEKATSDSYISTAIAVSNGAKVTINGGTFAGTSYGAYVYSSGGTVIFKDNPTVSGEVAVRADTSNGAESAVQIENGTFTGSLKKSDTATIAISGGTFKTEIKAEWCAEGFIPTKNSDGTYSVKKGSYVAAIGSTNYETLEAAITAAKKGKTVKLLTDVEQNSELSIDKSITLDLAGHKIYNTVDIWDEKATPHVVALINIESGAEVTITGNGTIEAKKDDCYTIYLDDGNLTIENGTFVGNISAVQVFKGTLTINGGHFSLIQKMADGKGEDRYLINCIDEAFTAGDATVAIYGGTFVGFDPNVSPEAKVDGKVPSFAAEGVGVDKDADGNFTAKAGMTAQIVAKDGGSVAAYETLADAVAAAKDGETVKLLANCESDRINLEDKSVTVDLNGKTLTSTAAYGVMFCAKNGNTINIDGTTEGSKLVGTLMVTAGTDGHIVINGGTYENAEYCPIYVNGAVSSDESTVTIKDATVIALAGTSDQDNGAAIYLAGYAVSKFTNVTVSAPVTGIEIRAGKLTLDNCDVTGGKGEIAESANGNGTTVKNAALAISQHNTKKVIDVTINGGTYTGTAALYQTDVQGTGSADVKAEVNSGTFIGIVKAETDKTIAISGGTFSEPVPENYCAEGYIPKDNGDGTYGVAEFKPFEIWTGFSGTKVAAYKTLAEAVTNLGENKWIVVGSNYTLTENFTIPEGVYLDVATGVTLTIADGVTLTVAANAKRLGVRDGATVVNNGTIMVCGTSYSNGFVMLYGTLTGNALSVPDGYFLDNNRTNYYAAQSTFTITYADGSSKTVGALSSENLAGAAKATLLRDLDDFARTISGVADGFVFDLGGHTITGKETASNAVLTVRDPMTIINGTIKYASSNKGGGALNTSADVTIGANAIIDGGAGYGVWTGGYGHTLTVNGTVKTDGAYAITGNGLKSGDLIDDCDITVNDGAEISATNGIGIYHPQLGTVTVNGGTITGHTGIQMCAGKLVVSGGEITSTGANEDHTGSENAMMDGAAISIVNRNYPGGIPTAEISGGTFKASGKDALAIRAYDYTNDKVAVWTDAGTYVNISGGTFSSIPENMTALCAEGYIPELTPSGAYEVVTADYVAEIGDTRYTSLANAIAAAKDGETVKLIANFSTDATKTTATDRLIVGKSITLDLNGYKMTIPGELEPTDNWAAFYINGGTLTVKDSTKSTGAIIGADKTEENPKYRGGVYLFHLQSGNLVIENGTFYAGGTVANVRKGTATINGGKFSVYPDVDTQDSRYLLNCIDKAFTDGDAHIIVNGGTFEGFDPRNNAAEGKGTSFVAEGVGVNADADGNFVAKANMLVQLVDAEGNSVAAYDTLWEAFTDAKDLQNTTLIVLQDITDSDPVYIDATNTTGSITLDLNDYNISFIENEWSEKHSGFNIQNATALDFIITGKGTITAAASNIAAIRVQSSSLSTKTTLTIEKDVTAIGHTGVMVDKYQTVAPGGNGITVNIAGTVKSVNNGIGVYVNGSITEQQPVINVMSTARIEADSWGMYLAGNNKTTVASGAQISGTGTGIEIRAGELTLNDCTVTGGSGELWANANGSGTTVGNAAVAVSQHNTNLPITVTVNGGTYTGTAAFYQFDGRTDTTGTSGEVKTSITRGTFLGQVAAETGVLVITGGCFSADVTKYCATGYQCNLPTADEPLYTVTKKDAVVTVSRKLTLANNLIITYTAKMPTDYAEPYAEFNFWNNSVNEWQTSKVEGISTGTDADGNATYTFAFTGVNPQRMNDTLKMTLFAKTPDSSGFVAITKEYTDSVAAYCNAVINNSTYNVDGKWTEVLSNLVAYGAASQKYMKYNETALVTDSVLNCVTKDYTETQEITKVSGVSRKDGGITITSVGMVLSSSYAVRVFFTLNDTTSLSDVTFTASIGGSSEQHFSKDDFTEQSYNGGTRYYFDYTGLNARQLDSEITFTATVSGTQDDTLGYSANTYLQHYITNNPSANTVWNELVKWLFNYGWSCKNFK